MASSRLSRTVRQASEQAIVGVCTGSVGAAFHAGAGTARRAVAVAVRDGVIAFQQVAASGNQSSVDLA